MPDKKKKRSPRNKAAFNDGLQGLMDSIGNQAEETTKDGAEAYALDNRTGGNTRLEDEDRPE